MPGLFAISQLPAGVDAHLPAWVWAGDDFTNVTRTADELSVICRAEKAPPAVRTDGDWRLLKLIGPFAFSAVGVLVSFAQPLGAAGISVLAIATFDTDYLLVKTPSLERTLAVLAEAGHQRVG